MDIEIVDEEENPMLHRTDVRFELTHEDATPSRLSVRDSLAAMLNKDSAEVVVRELDTKYGMRRTVGLDLVALQHVLLLDVAGVFRGVVHLREADA